MEIRPILKEELPGAPGRFLRLLEATVLIVVILYFGRPVLLPVAVAVLLTFLLAPAVNWFEERRFPRVVAVMLVGSLIFASLGLVTWKTSQQFADLVTHLTTYERNFLAKVRAFQDAQPSVLHRITEMVGDVTKELEQTADDTKEAAEKTEHVIGSPNNNPTPVTVVPAAQAPFEMLSYAVGSVAGPLEQVFKGISCERCGVT